MAQLIGDRIPAPLRFELGVEPGPGSIGRAILFATVDADGAPRIAVLSTSHVAVADERTLRIVLHSSSATRANAMERPKGAIWYVLDAAAYTVKGTLAGGAAEGEDGYSFDLDVESVWMDFRSDAPMTAGPTYRVPEEP